jgi:hypothetical protein
MPGHYGRVTLRLENVKKSYIEPSCTDGRWVEGMLARKKASGL